MTDDVLIEDNAIPFPKNRAPRSRKIVIAIFCACLSIALGILCGFLVAGQNPTDALGGASATAKKTQTNASTATGDSPTESKPEDFRDSSVGIIQKKPAKETLKQGTHILKRDDLPAYPIYLSAPTIDLSAYEGKHVKIYGVTFEGGTKDWYLTVNKVEEL